MSFPLGTPKIRGASAKQTPIPEQKQEYIGHGVWKQADGKFITKDFTGEAVNRQVREYLNGKPMYDH